MANKKINQLVAKTTIQSTDLFPIGDATTGTLFKKTIADLQSAIGGAVISVNGLVGTVVLDTDDILELPSPTNKYFTEARARAAISLTTSGSSGASTYSSSTGVLNVPTYTLAGLGGITASFLSGGTGITYNSTTGVIAYSGTVYTDSSVRNLFSGSTGISYNSSTGAISSTITQYTDALARASISGTSPITYNSSTGAIGITQASGSTNGFLSSTDWNTFNNKLSSITLTTTGTSGAATYSAGTLNIPQYQAVLTNPVTGTGTTGQVTFWNGSGTVTGDSGLFWNNTNKRLGIGTATPVERLDINSGTSLPAFINLSGNANTSGTSNVVIGQNSDDGGYFWNRKASFLSLGTSNTERARITSGGAFAVGNAGNGTGYGIEILNTSNQPRMALVDNATYTGVFKSNGLLVTLSNDSANALTLNTTAIERMRITAGGSVGIGVTSPNGMLHVNGRIYGVTSSSYADFNSGGIISYGAGSTSRYTQIGYDTTGGYGWIQALITGVAYSNLTINAAGGNLLLGTLTDNGERLYVSGNIRATGTITANSDINLKKNLLKIENALEKVEQINGYTYEFKSDDSKRHAGVIAQEIEGVLPEIVNKGNDGLLGVEYGNISALLIEAIKDLKSQNKSLVARLEALEK
jgi:hypothetical protein